MPRRVGLRPDQAAAVWHVLTSARTVEIVTGPAGTGKTRVLATTAGAWDGPVFGTATSQNATNELRAVGVQVAANTTRLLWPSTRPPARYVASSLDGRNVLLMAADWARCRELSQRIRMI